MRGSRASGTNPRALGTNPRALTGGKGKNRALYSKAKRMAWKAPEKHGAGLPSWLRFEVLKRDRFQCAYCGARGRDGVTLEVDHIKPKAAGGTDDPANLTTSCHRCNHGKGATKLTERRI